MFKKIIIFCFLSVNLFLLCAQRSKSVNSKANVIVKFSKKRFPNFQNIKLSVDINNDRAFLVNQILIITNHLGILGDLNIWISKGQFCELLMAKKHKFLNYIPDEILIF
jgi:hypothetical protein